jgi:hypothetical protein
MFWVNLLVYAVFTVLSELVRPKPSVENAKPAALGDFNFPTSTEGRVVPLIWGTVQLAGPNIVWYGDLVQDPITVSQKTGLFSSEDVVTGYRYFLGIQFGLCRGDDVAPPILKHIWIGDDLVSSDTVTDGNVTSINRPDLFGGNTLGNGGVTANVRLFAGTETQAISAYLASRLVTSLTVHGPPSGSGYNPIFPEIVTVVGGTFTTPATILITSVDGGGGVLTAELEDPGIYTVRPTNPVSVSGGSGTGAQFDLTFGTTLQNFPGGTPPAYRGTCYALMERGGVVPAVVGPPAYPAATSGYIGNSTSIKPWKFELVRIPDGLGIGSFATVNLADANPANVLYEILTNTDWGLAVPAGDIDTTSFSAAGTVLHDEGNGFSFVLDSPKTARDVIDIIQQQIDGLIFQNQLTGKWSLKLARGGYSIPALPLVSEATCLEFKNFARGSWKDTTNQVRVEFVDRGDSYKTTYAPAQDMANIRLQGGTNVSVTESYPGVKNRTLANAIAWRDLRSLSYPTAKAQVVVDRSFYATQPTDVVRYTNTTLGIVDLPMRVIRIDLGELTDGRITLDLIEDVFVSRAGSYTDPPPSGWTPPSDQLKPFFYQLAFEAPRGFTTRAFGTPSDRVWASGRRIANELGFQVWQRNAPGATSGPYAIAGEGFQLMLVGRLNAALPAGTGTPSATLILRSTPDSQADLLNAIRPAGSTSDLGTNLTSLLLVDDEFMLVMSAQVSGGNVELDAVYRGALDTVQAAHANGARVYLVSAGGVLTDTVFTQPYNVDIKLLPETAISLLDISQASAISFAMDNRLRRPYAPASVDLAGTTFATTVSLEAQGSGPETYGFLSHLLRRDFRTVDEVAALTTDAGSIFGDFPAANTTTHEVDVRKTDNTLLYTLTTSTRDATVLRLHILRETNGVIPTNLRLRMRSHHLVDGVGFYSRVDLVWDFAVTTALTGQFNFGALAASTASNVYTSTQSGTYAFTLSSAFTTGNVEYRINGGAWLTLIAAGATTGSILAVVAGQTIEVRHLSTDPGAEKELDMAAPGGGQNAYAVLYV